MGHTKQLYSVIAGQVNQAWSSLEGGNNPSPSKTELPAEGIAIVKRPLPSLNLSVAKESPRINAVIVEKVVDPALPLHRHNPSATNSPPIEQTQTHGEDHHPTTSNNKNVETMHQDQEVKDMQPPLPVTQQQQQRNGHVEDAVVVVKQEKDNNDNSGNGNYMPSSDPDPAPPFQQQPIVVEPSNVEAQPQQGQQQRPRQRRIINVQRPPTTASLTPTPEQQNVSWINRIPAAPIFQPTPEQWKKPLKYIASIKKEAARTGICIIRPLPDPSDTVCNNHDINAFLTSKQHKNLKFTSRLQPMNRKWLEWDSNDFYRNPKTYNLQLFKKLADDNLKSRFEYKASSLRGLKMDKNSNSDGEGVYRYEEAYWRQRDMTDDLWVDYANDVEGSLFPPLPAKNSSGGHEDDSNAADDNSKVHKKKKDVNQEIWGGGKKRKKKASTHTSAQQPRCPPLHPDGRWDLRHLPTMEGSALKWCPYSLPGITAPMLYIGQLFSTFAWHVEDHSLLSINYSHAGDGKIWYGVPGSSADQFEELARQQIFLELCKKDATLLNQEEEQLRVTEALMQKTAMFSPKLMLDAGIPVYRAVQQPGDFVVTFPRAFHAGFSTGFNLGEAVNFAINEDWWEAGEEMRKKYRLLEKVDMIPFEQLLCMEGIEAVERGLEMVRSFTMQVSRGGRGDNNNNKKKSNKRMKKEEEGQASGSGAREQEEEEDEEEMVDVCTTCEEVDLSQMLDLFGAKVEDTAEMLKSLKKKGAVEVHVEEPRVDDDDASAGGASGSINQAVEEYMSLICSRCGEQAFLCTSVVESRQQKIKKKKVAIKEEEEGEEEEERGGGKRKKKDGKKGKKRGKQEEEENVMDEENEVKEQEEEEEEEVEEKLPPHSCLRCTHQAFKDEQRPEQYSIKLYIKSKLWGQMKFLWKQARQCGLVY